MFDKREKEKAVEAYEKIFPIAASVSLDAMKSKVLGSGLVVEPLDKLLGTVVQDTRDNLTLLSVGPQPVCLSLLIS